MKTESSIYGASISPTYVAMQNTIWKHMAYGSAERSCNLGKLKKKNSAHLSCTGIIFVQSPPRRLCSTVLRQVHGLGSQPRSQLNRKQMGKESSIQVLRGKFEENSALFVIQTKTAYIGCTRGKKHRQTDAFWRVPPYSLP